MRVLDQLPRQTDRQELFALEAVPARIAHEPDAQRVAIDCANQLFLLRQRRCGLLLHSDLRGLPHSLNAHAAAQPRDVDLADVFALADAEHRARVELFAPLRLRAEGVGRTAAVPERVDGEDADRRDHLDGVCPVVLPLRRKRLSLRLGVAPARVVPVPQRDGIGRIIAEIERYGVEIGGRRCKGHFQHRRDIAAVFVQRVRAAGNDGHTL